MTPHGAAFAFLKRAVSSPAVEHCIEWPFSRSPKGYGRVWFRGQMRPASRVALIFATGTDPADRWATHIPGRCHNPPCINPAHLEWGTPKKNHADQIVDGTDPRGERNGNARLTTAQVLEIVGDSRTLGAIAAEHGVCITSVWNIQNGKRWGHLTGLDAASNSRPSLRVKENK